MRRLLSLPILLLLLVGFVNRATSQELSIDVNRPTAELSPYLYGLFFEDINYGADGGLYAELVQNRSFEYFPIWGKQNNDSFYHTPMTAWSEVKEGNAVGHIYVTRTSPLNSDNLNHIAICNQDKGGYLGVANSGYDGILLKQGDSYNLSLHSRFEQRRGAPKNSKYSIIVRLEDEQGNVLDSKSWDTAAIVNGHWQKLEATFTPTKSAQKGSLVILTQGDGEFKFDVVSLMPQDTFRGHRNGLRKDLAEALEAINPKFLRFPGGCILHGWGLDNRYDWKDTMGDIAERKANWNRWGYHQTYGIGYFEYFQFCEDVDATPLPVVSVGVSCSFCSFEATPMEHLQELIDDALDLVEFANGAVDTEWGSVRAAMGHPEPFGLEYICLGNEEADTPEFHERIPLFVEAFKKRYPEIKIIGTSGLSPTIPLYDEMAKLGVWSSDEHYYQDPEWYIENQDRFDSWDRSLPKVFVGEYASRGNTLYNAISEAVYLTGIERNSDIVEMTCYAPLFARYGHTQWKQANLIYFNNEQVVKTPNYYVQALFGNNKGDQYLANQKIDWVGKELAVSTTYEKSTNTVIIKVANASNKSYQLPVTLNGVKRFDKRAELTLITGDKTDVNTLESPTTVQSVESEIKLGRDIVLDVPAYSVQCVRVNVVK